MSILVNEASFIVRVAIIAIVALSTVSCRQNSDEETILKQALEIAKENKTELLKVIDHYSESPKDSIKLRMAKFIIKGLPGLMNYDSAYLQKFDTVIKKSQQVVRSLEATGKPWKTTLKYQYYDSMINIVNNWSQENRIFGPGESYPSFVTFETIKFQS